MSANALDADRIDAYLHRLDRPDFQHTVDGLAALQAAHLMAVPFHNLLLLANDGRPFGLQPLLEVVDEAIAGVGGNCDRTTPPFTALLQGLGFDAHLATATVREPGDHFVSVVHIDGRRLLSDVGNGHPYLRPWDLDGPVQEQSCLGWRFRFDPRATAGPTLRRDLGDGVSKTVYVVDPTPRRYEHFAPMVSAHYTQAGFGPFLSGLRAARILPDAVLTLRDDAYARDSRFGRSSRRVAGRDAFAALLVDRFGLPERLVADAVEVAAKRRPELFGPPPAWIALGVGLVEDSADVVRPTRDHVPDVLVSLATVGRGASVGRLLETLAEEVAASGYPGKVGVLLLENHPPDAAKAAAPTAIPVHRVPIADTLPALARAAEAGVIPSPDGLFPAPIGAAREAQLAAIRAHLQQPVPGLPHPSIHPMVVWMVDDDIAFQQLSPDGSLTRRTHLLFRIARFWATLPQHAVLLGTFTGDPPIPMLDMMHGVITDLDANIHHLVDQTEQAPWTPSPSWRPPSATPTGESYYDLAETPADHHAPRPYLPRPGLTTPQVAAAMARDIQRLTDGCHPTRSLTWDGSEAPPVPSVRRGGNTVFLDLDALFRWPTPCFRCADGVVTRRGDTIWGTLAAKEDPLAVREVTLPVLHGRVGQGTYLAPDAARRVGAQGTSAQLRGTVLARALAGTAPIESALRDREARVSAHRRALVDRIQGGAPQVWRLFALGGDEEDSLVSVDTMKRELAKVAALAEGGVLPGDATELSRILERLPESVQRWRGGW